MISNFKVIQKHSYNLMNVKSKSYKYSVQFYEKTIKSRFEYNENYNTLYFFGNGFPNNKQPYQYFFSEEELRLIINKVITFPEFRLKHLVNPIKINYMVYGQLKTI